MDNRQQIFFEVKIDYQRSALSLSSKFRAQSSELKVLINSNRHRYRQ